MRSFISLRACYKPHSVRFSHIARFFSRVCSTVIEGATPAGNAGRTVGSDCGADMGKGPFGGAGCAGGAGRLVRSEGQCGGELGCIALGCQGIVIGRRLVEEKGASQRLPACKAVAGGVGREGAGLIKDEEVKACCCFCALGEIDHLILILADDV